MDSKKKLLIVDDDLIVRTVCQHYFQRFFNVVLANNGINALAFLNKEMVDLVLTDIYMPEMSGIELTKAIRQLDNQNKQVIIIGMSATSEEIYQEAIAARMNQLHQKPVDFLKIHQYLSQANAISAS
jgi:two-component system capsular synthesis sensor histidine kinase RcsC